MHPHPRPSSGAPARAGLLLLATALAWSVGAGPAHAHGIGGDAADASIFEFVGIGITHMLLGWDHLLFIGGVVVLAGQPRRAAKLISVFVVGHSLTLVVASLAGWQVPAGWVDVVIAISLVFVGAVGMLGRPERWDWFYAVVFGFGLIHGLGLASRLHDIGLPEDGMLWRVIAFNVGIEIGQLTAIFVLAALAWFARDLLGPSRAPKAGQLAGAALLLVGSMASAVLAYKEMSAPDLAPVAAGTSGAIEEAGCTIAERSVVLHGGGGHAAKSFFGADEESPLDDFGHSLGDGYVVVMYDPALPSDQVDELAAYVTSGEGGYMVAGPDTRPTGAGKVTATSLEQTMTCDQVDVDAIGEFTADWYETLGG